MVYCFKKNSRIDHSYLSSALTDMELLTTEENLDNLFQELEKVFICLSVCLSFCLSVCGSVALSLVLSRARAGERAVGLAH